ncbi:MAG: YerC/YecD family TrpR-related protein [Bdellovibrionales bacterium]
MKKGRIQPVTNKKAQEAAKAALCQAIVALRTPDECARFLRDLCTPTEIDALAERWTIARLLASDRHSYRDIAAQTGASTATVTRVARFLKEEPYQGYKLILERTGA